MFIRELEIFRMKGFPKRNNNIVHQADFWELAVIHSYKKGKRFAKIFAKSQNCGRNSKSNTPIIFQMFDGNMGLFQQNVLKLMH